MSVYKIDPSTSNGVIAPDGSWIDILVYEGNPTDNDRKYYVDLLNAAHAPTPAPGEGPYKVEMCHESNRHVVRDADGVAVFASERPSLAAVRMVDLNNAYKQGHSSALASREVADAVAALRLVKHCGVNSRWWDDKQNKTCDLLSVVDTALAPFAGGAK